MSKRSKQKIILSKVDMKAYMHFLLFCTLSCAAKSTFSFPPCPSGTPFQYKSSCTHAALRSWALNRFVWSSWQAQCSTVSLKAFFLLGLPPRSFRNVLSRCFIPWKITYWYQRDCVLKIKMDYNLSKRRITLEKKDLFVGCWIHFQNWVNWNDGQMNTNFQQYTNYCKSKCLFWLNYKKFSMRYNTHIFTHHAWQRSAVQCYGGGSLRSSSWGPAPSSVPESFGISAWQRTRRRVGGTFWT